MKMKSLFHAGLLAFGLGLGCGASFASDDFDACVRKLCVDTQQGDCWIKAGAQFCDKSGASCRELEDHTAAKVIRKTGKRWEMETKSGTGWVNQRWMMVSGDKC